MLGQEVATILPAEVRLFGKQCFQQDADKLQVGCFVHAPALVHPVALRLERRAEDASGVIEKRLKNARTEIAHWEEYDYVLVNEDLNTTFINLQAILSAERLRRQRQLGLAPIIERLDQELVTLTP